MRIVPRRAARNVHPRRPDRRGRRVRAEVERHAQRRRPQGGLTGSVEPLGDVAQLVAHRLCKAGVAGSSPVVSTSRPAGRDALSRLASLRRRRLTRLGSTVGSSSHPAIAKPAPWHRPDQRTSPARPPARPPSPPPPAGALATPGCRAWRRPRVEVCDHRSLRRRTCAPRTAPTVSAAEHSRNVRHRLLTQRRRQPLAVVESGDVDGRGRGRRRSRSASCVVSGRDVVSAIPGQYSGQSVMTWTSGRRCKSM